MIDIAHLTRIDSYPYRHKLSEVMAQPVLTCPETLGVGEACSLMADNVTSSVVITDEQGRASGIITERNIIRALAQRRGAALDAPVRELMSSPVHTVRGDAFLFVAIARMTRLSLRHLVVVDGEKRPIGMITSRALLKVRTTEALVIGDTIAAAASPAEMEKAKHSLPILARNLLDEGLPAKQVAEVISSVLRDLTTRAAELAEASMQDEGWGPAPARWSLLVLGSAGRGESLLTFDQDNAIVHEGTPENDKWFAELGKRLADCLHAAGIPYCDGEVMARNPAWRKSLEEWKKEIRGWALTPDPQTVMNTDIFFDFQCVHGDRALAEQLRAYALETVSTNPFFLQLLASHVAHMDVPLGFFGEFTTTGGRLNAKKFGLLPLVSAARAKAVGHGITATASAERYQAMAAAGKMHEKDLHDVLDVHELILKVMLEQQLADIAQGIKPSADIEPRRFDPDIQRRLKDGFKRIKTLKTIVGGLLGAVG